MLLVLLYCNLQENWKEIFQIDVNYRRRTEGEEEVGWFRWVDHAPLPDNWPYLPREGPWKKDPWKDQAGMISPPPTRSGITWSAGLGWGLLMRSFLVWTFYASHQWYWCTLCQPFLHPWFSLLFQCPRKHTSNMKRYKWQRKILKE